MRAFPEPLAEVLTRENRELRAIAADATTAAQNLRDELLGAQERLRRVEAVAWSPSLQSCGGTRPDAEGCFVQDVLFKLRAALDAEP